MVLTTRQREVLRAVHDSGTWGTTIRELGAALGLRSSYSVWLHLRNLEGVGLVERKGPGRWGVRITERGIRELAGRVA